MLSDQIVGVRVVVSDFRSVCFSIRLYILLFLYQGVGLLYFSIRY